MFAIIFVYVLFDLWKIIEKRTTEIFILVISSLGILFIGYFTVKEVSILLEKGFNAYFFGLPTCAFGLIFFIAIFIVNLISFLKK